MTAIKKIKQTKVINHYKSNHSDYESVLLPNQTLFIDITKEKVIKESFTHLVLKIYKSIKAL